VTACAELSGDSVVVHAINERDVPADELDARVRAGLKSLDELCMFSEQLGVKISLENLPGDSNWHPLTMSIMEGARMPNLYFCLDTCHSQIGLADPLELVRWMAGRVRTLHLSDTFGQSDTHLIPGEAKVDFSAIARELGAAGFDGVVDLECSLWMLRQRVRENRSIDGDPPECSTPQYLAKAFAAAINISLMCSRHV
jgi:sugar phosphate isomerase/epimerase